MNLLNQYNIQAKELQTRSTAHTLLHLLNTSPRFFSVEGHLQDNVVKNEHLKEITEIWESSGSVLGKVAADTEKQVIISQLIKPLHHVMEKHGANVRDLERLKHLFETVRACSTPVHWNAMIQLTAAMSKYDLSETFKDILKELARDEMSPSHLIVFYALLIDVTYQLVENGHSVNILHELKNIHNVIMCTVDYSVLSQTLTMIQC